MQNIKVVVIGDGAVGKTCMLISYATNTFPREYVPTVTHEGKQLSLGLWDTAGPEEYGTWMPEIRHHCPKTPILLIGTKLDLRDNADAMARLAELGETLVSTSEIHQLARELGAAGYYECSALTQQGLKAVFENALSTALHPSVVGPAPKPPMPPKPLSPFISPEQLPHSRSLGSLAGIKDFSDCTFVLRDKSEVPAHKVILAAGMPILHIALLLKGGELPPVFKLKTVETKSALAARTLIVQELAFTNRIPLGGVWQYDHWVAPFASSLARYGLTAFTVGGVVHLVGGADSQGQSAKNMLRFEMSGNRWLEPLEFEGTPGVDYPFGNLHSTCVNHNTNEVILFGGKSNRYSNTTWLFNTETSKWKKIETKGAVPTPRYGHSAVLHERKMIIFGGYNDEVGKCNDMYELSLDSYEWAQIKPEGDHWPHAKFNHQATALTVGAKTLMVLFGGSNGTHVLDEVNVFDLHEQTWVPMKIKSGPSPRSGFSASNIDTQQWIIYGGQDTKTQNDFDDCWTLSESKGTLVWKQIAIKGENRTRYYHASAYDRSLGRIYLFCGKTISDTMAADLTVLSVRGEATGEWVKEEQTVIEVDLEPAVFHCILNSVYTGLPANSREFSVEIVKEASDFFLKFPRFTPDERRKIMVDLALNPNPPLSDVCFEFDGKKRVYAHKALLAGSNDYFSAIFSSGMKESQLDVISLSDIDESELTVLKEFLYSGRTDSLTAKNVVNMIRLANKYNAKELLSHCEAACKEFIESFDLWELYQLATEHNCRQLQEYLVWAMRASYEDIKDKAWFKKELPENVRKEVVAGQWPGDEYKRSVEAWKKSNKGGKDCVVM